jgi:hypothetical protein
MKGFPTQGNIHRFGIASVIFPAEHPINPEKVVDSHPSST